MAITPDNLRDQGYREYPVPAIDKYDRLFQKRIDDQAGAMYFVNFREWHHSDGTNTYDADMSCETATHGHVWVTIKEDTIEATENRAGLMWAAAGSVYYDL
jgi:hypothetical protein